MSRKSSAPVSAPPEVPYTFALLRDGTREDRTRVGSARAIFKILEKAR
jgi:hypothetical protein